MKLSYCSIDSNKKQKNGVVKKNASFDRTLQGGCTINKSKCSTRDDKVYSPGQIHNKL
jgi:hypothetical protein